MACALRDGANLGFHRAFLRTRHPLLRAKASNPPQMRSMTNRTKDKRLLFAPCSYPFVSATVRPESLCTAGIPHGSSERKSLSRLCSAGLPINDILATDRSQQQPQKTPAIPANKGNSAQRCACWVHGWDLCEGPLTGEVGEDTTRLGPYSLHGY